ncbi:hypothetical protein BC826DRAFT_738940 [Russula brevipes]|nr:hypothetical protein BC826DRAFT_738940 [Russula brevipes]
MGPPLSDSASLKSPKLDIRAFVKYMKNIGRAYRKQATELVSICRTFVTAQEQTPSSYNQLRSALQVVDEALKAASEVASKTSRDVDDKFDEAFRVLGSYEREFHSRETIAERMAAAKAKDKSCSTTLKRVLKKLSLKATEDVPPEPTTVVEFLLLKCLPDDSPTVVRQVLSRKSSLQEILWNFSRFKDNRRLTLKQNPHFYKVSDLPMSREAYIGEFETKPINENFQTRRSVFLLITRPQRVAYFLKR